MSETVRYRKGDKVRFRFALREVEGVVSEDRGPIGLKGRHLYGVKFSYGAEVPDPAYIELPAVKLQKVEDPVPAG